MKRLLSKTSILAGVALIYITANSVAGNLVLYKTSFEKMPIGKLSHQTEGNVIWKGLDNARIINSHQNSGKNSLHIAGGNDNTVELKLDRALQNVRGIQFQAERWTRADPFEFRIQAHSNGEWKESSNLDKLVKIGKFSTAITAAFPKGKITGIRLVCTAPKGKGILIDDLTLLKNTPTNITKAPEVASEPIKKLLRDNLLFKSGTQDTKVFRIPAIITAANGDLIATCDARRDHGGDLHSAQDIDIAIRRSSDNGKTWTDMDLICDLGKGHPASDPSLILDESTGEIFCFYNYMNRSKKKEYRLWVQSSKDNGKSWSKPRDITDEITLPEWKYNFKFMTSGRGCQTRDGVMLHTLVRPGNGLHVFGSKDHGKSWFLINKAPLSPGDESKIIELADGRLMINCRVNGYGTRYVHISEDDGKTWKGHRESQLVDPGCNGAVLRYTSTKDGYSKNRLIFSNANSFSGRKNLALRISYDEGETWSDGKVINAGTSMYSDLTICADGSIGILYEPGNGVRFTSISLKDLTDGKDRLQKPYKVPSPRN